MTDIEQKEQWTDLQRALGVVFGFVLGQNYGAFEEIDLVKAIEEAGPR